MTLTLRPADSVDSASIKALIRSAHINPLGIDWRRFTVAVTPQGELIGCGQIKPHRDGSHELASIAVVPAWRKRGVARAIIEHLLAANTGTLYLTCRSRLGPFYEKFGFSAILESEMPPYFRCIKRLVKLLGVNRSSGDTLLVMRHND
jgi:N-acetylglutamate synthase-like GNAT family acetyltransferase